MLVPAAMSFCKYHLLHHRHMGELTLDADIPGPVESRVVGTSVVMKTLWVASLGLIQGSLRPLRLTTVGFLDVWTVINLASQGVAIGLLLLWMGPEPLKYLGVSTVMAIGLHPLGARWIQEHYVFKSGQETYSYYGPLNRLSFNVGYHNEQRTCIESLPIGGDQRHPTRTDVTRHDPRSRCRHGSRLASGRGADIGDHLVRRRAHCCAYHL